jgi:drug/metabolite transporter (DMT)-like permease
MHLSKYHLAIVAITLCTIIWSAAAPLFKWAMQDTPPSTLLFFRFLVATLIMIPLVQKQMKIKFEDFYKILLLAITGITFNIGLFYLGLSLSQSINEPIISSTMPIFLIIGAALFFHEIPRKKVIAGTLVSLIGVIIIVIRPADHVPLTKLLTGNILLIISVLSLVCYTFLLKQFKLAYSSSTIIFWMFLLATITFFPFFIWGARATHTFGILDARGGFGVLYGAIFCSIFGQIFYNFAVQSLKSSELGIFMYLGPVITALVAIPLLHEEITFSYLLGSVFVFLGLFIAEIKFHYHFFHPQPNQDPWLESGP